jgi:hypothetical protein
MFPLFLSHVTSRHRAGSPSANDLDSYAGGVWFQSCPGQNISVVSQPFKANSGEVPRLSNNLFLPNPFQFIIHLPSYHSTLCNVDTDSVVK